MCLLFFAWRSHRRYPLILAANRDEYYRRPSASAHFWPDRDSVLGGRDLEQGGSWMAVDRSGRWAALTNYRQPGAPDGARSRGHLVSDYLLGDQGAAAYASRIGDSLDHYAGFNLVLGDPDSVLYCSNRSTSSRLLAPGLYGLSNHLLDTPWPKVTAGKAALAAESQDSMQTDSLFTLLADRTVAPDDALPDTGIGLSWERLLAPAFITSPEYGTRSATVVLMAEDHILFEERSFPPHDNGGPRPDHYQAAAFRFRRRTVNRRNLDKRL